MIRVCCFYLVAVIDSLVVKVSSSGSSSSFRFAPFFVQLTLLLLARLFLARDVLVVYLYNCCVYCALDVVQQKHKLQWEGEQRRRIRMEIIKDKMQLKNVLQTTID